MSRPELQYQSTDNEPGPAPDESLRAEVRRCAFVHALNRLNQGFTIEQSPASLTLAKRLVRGDTAAHESLYFGCRQYQAPGDLGVVLVELWEPMAQALSETEERHK